MSIQAILSDLPATRDAREALYRHFHRHPELSLQEDATAARIEAELAGYGIEEILRIGRTGVVAVLRNGPGPVVAMRGVAVREAGMVGLAFNALMAIAALISVTIFIPKQKQA